MAARHKIWTPQIVRDRMRVSALMKRIEKCAMGELEMTPAQIKAAEVVLRKCMPDLRAVDHTGTLRHLHAKDMTDEELTAVAAGSGAGVAGEASGEEISTPVH